MSNGTALATADIADDATGTVRVIRRVVHGEWTKLRTVRSTGWLAAGIAASMVVLGVIVTASVSTSHCPSPAECLEDTTKLSLTGVWLGQALVVVLAVLAVTNEYSSGVIQTTLMVTPRRATVLLTKAVVVTATAFVAGTLGVLGSLAVGRVILAGNGFTPTNGYPLLSLADAPTVRAASGTVLYLGLIALLGVGVGMIIRDTAAAITTVLTLLYVAPLVAALVSDPTWSERLQRLSPMTAGLAIQATANLDRSPITPWAGLGVLAAYATAAMLLGGRMFVARDA